MIFAGWILYALVYAGFAFVDAAWQIWLLFFIYGAFFGLTEGVEKALVADLGRAGKTRHGLRLLQSRLRHHGLSGFSDFRRIMDKIRRGNRIFGKRVNFHLCGGFAFDRKNKSKKLNRV